MFSKGQLLFALVFFIAFVIVMIVLYRQDFKKYASIYYKDYYKVLLFIVGVMSVFWLFIRFYNKI